MTLNTRKAELSVSRATEYEHCKLMASNGATFLKAYWKSAVGTGLMRDDPPYSETLYNSIIVLLKVICDVVHLAAQYCLYVCILQQEIGERVSRKTNGVTRGENTHLPLLGQTAAFEQQHCEELGRGAAVGLRGGTKKECKCISPTVVV